MKDEYVAYVGTYTHGSSIGIHLYDVNVEEGTLTERKVIPVNNSSHIARSLNGKYLYSIADEGVAVFAVEDDGDLTPINKVDIDGMRGCYLSVDKTGRYLFVAGYHDGKVTVVHTHKDGRLGSLMDGVFHKGLGSVAERNFRPHVSCVVPTPDNKYVCAVDNGIDQIKMYKLNTQRDRLKLVDILRCERESGPREIVFSESGKYAYVIYELMNKVDVFSYRDTGNGPGARRCIRHVPFPGSPLPVYFYSRRQYRSNVPYRPGDRLHGEEVCTSDQRRISKGYCNVPGRKTYRSGKP